MMTAARKKINLLHVGGLLLFLVILPGGSWLYLRSGFQYRRAALAELVQHGTIGAFELPDQHGNIFSSEALQQRITVAGVLPAESAQRDILMERLLTLHEQFDDRNELIFLLLADPAYVPDPAAFALEKGLTDTLQWTVLLAPQEEINRLATGFFYLPDHAHLALADTSRMVRRLYDSQDSHQFGRLIEHIAILLPRLADPDIEFRRQPEK